MENFDNKVLSSVHSSEARNNIIDITCESQKSNQRKRYLSRFFYHNPVTWNCKKTEEGEESNLCGTLYGICKNQGSLLNDVTNIEDGSDLVLKTCPSCEDNISEKTTEDNAVTRKEKTKQCEVLTIEHQMATSLLDVGYQVWSGALLLCDYLLHHQEDLTGSTVLDLGSGPGLTSIVPAIFANTVLCTDYSSEIVKLAERNWERNKGLLPIVGSPTVMFKVLDWTKDSPFEQGSSSGGYSLNIDDLDLLKSVSLILAAEVVYDDDITDAFFRTVYHLLTTSPAKQVVIAIEKRNCGKSQVISRCEAEIQDLSIKFKNSIKSFAQDG